MSKKKKSKNPESQVNLTHESDRGAVIVGAALLESALDEILLKEFEGQNLSKKQMDRLFDLSGPLASFGSKSLICRSFDLISADAFHDLEIIRGLRNRFAHGTEEVDFRSKEITAVVNSMHVAKHAAASVAGKVLQVKPKYAKAPAWEMQSKGLLTLTKVTFSLSVVRLELKIKVDALERAMRRMGWTGKVNAIPPPPKPEIRLYFVIGHEHAGTIDIESLPQETITDVEGRVLTGVRLTRKPTIRPPLTAETAACLCFLFELAEIEDFGLLVDGKPDSEAYWLVPLKLLKGKPLDRMAPNIVALLAADDGSQDLAQEGHAENS